MFATRTREPAVAGSFYPGHAVVLAETVDRYLRAGRPTSPQPIPKAVIAPHAGYQYSGPTAGVAWAHLAQDPDRVRRVVLLGPAHRVYVTTMAHPGVGRMATPLGAVEVDTDLLERLRVPASSAAHALEHSLEVHLPFLQRALPHAVVVPIVVGGATVAEVAHVLEGAWGGDETAIVVSSDLSHYLPYDLGRATDKETARHIVDIDPRPLHGDRACGAAIINGLLAVAGRLHLRVRQLDLRSSGDTAGTRDEVVGYGAFGFYESGVLP